VLSLSVLPEDSGFGNLETLSLTETRPQESKFVAVTLVVQ